MSATTAEAFELPRRPGASGALSFSWATPDGSRCGLARLGLSHGEDTLQGSALLVAFEDGVPQVLAARGGVPLGKTPALEDLSVAGVRATVDEPLTRWMLTAPEVELTFEAAGHAVGVEPSIGGMTGFEQIASVHGTVRGARLDEALGQRGFSVGAPDWRRLAAIRTLSAWFGDGHGVAFATARPGRAKGHDADESWAVVWDAAGVHAVEEPRLSTTYDPEGRQRRAGLELWVSEPSGVDDGEELLYPRRATGHVLCGTTLELGALTLDCSFFRWTMEGRSGIGRYDRLRTG